jgi:hypothetical protein
VILANLATGESWSFLEDETEIPAELGFSISDPSDAEMADLPALTPVPVPAEEIPDGEIWAAEGLAAGGPAESPESPESPETGEVGGDWLIDDSETVDVVEPGLVLSDATAGAGRELMETAETSAAEAGKPAVSSRVGIRIPVLGKILKL